MKFAAEMQKLQDPSALLFWVMLIELLHGQVLSLCLIARNTDIIVCSKYGNMAKVTGVHVQTLLAFFFAMSPVGALRKAGMSWHCHLAKSHPQTTSICPPLVGSAGLPVDIDY